MMMMIITMMMMMITMIMMITIREVYNPSRADTCLLTSAAWGAHTGAWLSWHLGLITDGPHKYSDVDLLSSVSIISYDNCR